MIDPRQLEKKLRKLVFELREKGEFFDLEDKHNYQRLLDQFPELPVNSFLVFELREKPDKSTFMIYETGYRHGIDDAASDIEEFIVEEIISKYGG